MLALWTRQVPGYRQVPDYKHEYQLVVLSSGLLGTNVSYLKTKKTYQPITDMEEENEKVQFLKSSGTSVLSVDSLEANGEPGVWMGKSLFLTVRDCPSAYIARPYRQVIYLPRESES